MKKLLTVLAIAGVSLTSMAQETEATEKYSVATNSFWSNWFVQGGVQWTAFYSSLEHGYDLSNNPFKSFRSNPQAAVAIGKWFTPGLGLRTKVSGIWGKCNGDSFKYWNAQEQVLFNLSNMLCGYNPNRVWNFIPYIGGGFGRNMSYDTYAMTLTAGFLNTFRLSNKVAINLDINWLTAEKDLDGVEVGATEIVHNVFKGHDNHVNVEIGLTYNLGKATWNKTPDVEAIKALSQGQIDALNAQVADAQSENAKLKQMLADKKNEANTQTVKEVVSAPVSVFFNIGKSKIASRKDLQNVKDLASVAKDNNSKIVVTGYADSKTGSAAYNKQLSQKRADAVANELVKMGVSRDNIETVAEGGVNTLSPVSYNRRATVAIK